MPLKGSRGTLVKEGVCRVILYKSDLTWEIEIQDKRAML